MSIVYLFIANQSQIYVQVAKTLNESMLIDHFVEAFNGQLDSLGQLLSIYSYQISSIDGDCQQVPVNDVMLQQMLKTLVPMITAIRIPKYLNVLKDRIQQILKLLNEDVVIKNASFVAYTPDGRQVIVQHPQSDRVERQMLIND